MLSSPPSERENHAAIGTLHIPQRAIVLQTLGSPLAVSPNTGPWQVQVTEGKCLILRALPRGPRTVLRGSPAQRLPALSVAVGTSLCVVKLALHESPSCGLTERDQANE